MSPCLIADLGIAQGRQYPTKKGRQPQVQWAAAPWGSLELRRNDFGWHGICSNRLFSGGGNVFGAGRLQQVLCPRNFVRGVTMYRQQNTAPFDSAFVPLGLILRDAHTDECADQSADRAANSQAGQGSHNRAGRNERTEARNRQCADTDQQSQGAAHYPPGSHASGRSLGRLRVLLMSELLRALVVGQEHRNVVVREPRRNDLVDGVFRLSAAFVNSKYRCLFACHVWLLRIERFANA